MKRVVVLFGAGASYGCGGVLPEAPPLGDRLYSELAKSYPGSWGSLSDELRKAFQDRGFEVGMRLVYERHGSVIPQLMREMAVYFIQFRPYAKRSLYSRFIAGLQNSTSLSQVSFATLNYECVLDFAILEAGEAIQYFPNQNPQGVSLWKLHGSSNMFAYGLAASPGILYDTGIVWQAGAQVFLDPNQVIEHCLVQTALAPIMSLYMEGKPLNISPGVVQQIQAAWSEEVRAARAVLIVGVRPVPEDEHVWVPLAETSADLHFIGDQNAFERWSSKRSTHLVSNYLGSRFHESYPSLVNLAVTYGTNGS